MWNIASRCNSYSLNLMLTFLVAGTPDWTLPNPEGELSPHIIFTRGVDWSVTPLGDMSTWSRYVRASFILCSPDNNVNVPMVSMFEMNFRTSRDHITLINRIQNSYSPGLRTPNLLLTCFLLESSGRLPAS